MAFLVAIGAFVGLLYLQVSSFSSHIQAPLLAEDVAWSRLPPANLKPTEVPQLVAITFDDNFGLASQKSVGGVNAIVQYYAGKRNPMGKGDAADFGSAPIRTTFFDTAIYMLDPATSVPGSARGKDRSGRNRAAWKSAVAAGHEIADHTVSHFNGGAVFVNGDECCRPRDWSAEQWRTEIASCRTVLTASRYGLGAAAIIGFRSPYLSFNDNLFTALHDLGFNYDSSLANCFDDAEDGTNCSWPYSLAQGSPDAETFARKLSAGPNPLVLPHVQAHPGLWELPVTTLIVPSDSLADKYQFEPGLRDRIANRAPMPYPSFYEPPTGKITGLDYTLLIDAGLSGDEMRAILSYNLDLHLAGNHSPLIFVAHAQLYTSRKGDPDAKAEANGEMRWKGLTAFISYAMSKPEVRIVSARDALAWTQGAARKRLSDSSKKQTAGLQFSLPTSGGQ